MTLPDAYTYLALLLASWSFPLVRSFEHRVRYIDYWPALAVGIMVSAAFYIPTDIWFTAAGHWGFSDRYTLGVRMLGLPVEEWLFFLIIPYCNIFIYACLERLVGVRDHMSWTALAWLIAMVCLGVGIANTHLAYTSVKLGAAGLFFAWMLWDRRGRGIGLFMVTYLITLIPLCLVNGVLTSWPVVVYDDTENLALRLSHLTGVPFLNIPVEDLAYHLGMLTLVVATMDRVRGVYQNKTAPRAVSMA